MYEPFSGKDLRSLLADHAAAKGGAIGVDQVNTAGLGRMA